MKKLMIALGVAAIAAGVQAATFNWANTAPIAVHDSVTPTEEYGVDLTSGTAYLIDAKKLGQEAFFTAAFAADNMAAYVASVAYNSGTLGSSSKFTDVANGSVSKGKASWTPDAKVYPDESKIQFYQAVVVKDGDQDYLYISELTKEQSVSGTGGNSFNFSNDDSLKPTFDAGDGFAGSGWYTQTVPEPTSGLLLLLGVAGLALRRRRA